LSPNFSAAGFPQKADLPFPKTSTGLNTGLPISRAAL
jgi:hypothetical protein